MKITIFVSKNITNQLFINLNTIGDVILVPELAKTYKSISTHPDIQMTIINQQLFIDDDSWVNINSIDINKDKLKQLKPMIITTNLGSRYPLSVPFNGKFSENTWIHHLDFTDKSILNYLKKSNIKILHTNQGYSGCSLLLLPNKKGITSDPGLAKTLRNNGFEIVLIHEGSIILDGFDHGFIGGCCGYYNGVVYIHGDLNTHPDGMKIREFILKQHIDISEVKKFPLTDIGSILFYRGECNE